MSAKQVGALLTSRRFIPLFGAQAFGAFNDQFLKMALITLVTWKEMSVMGINPDIIVPVAGSIFTAPFFLFSAMAGQVADKYDKALVLLRVKQAEIGIMLIAAISLIFTIPALMLLTLALMGAQSAFFSPTRNAVLPQWLSKSELITGNSLVNGIISITVLLGQALGIFLIVTMNGPMIVAGILIVFALLGWLSIRQAPPAPSTSKDIKIDPWIFPTIGRTLAFAFKTPDVLKPMLGTAWYYWLSAGVLILVPTYVQGVLHYERSVLIILMFLFTLGAIGGAITCMIFAKGERAIGISAIGALGITLSTLDLFILGENISGVAFANFVPATETTQAVLGTAKDFLGMPDSKRFIIDFIVAAFSASLFVIPLNAMAQSRAEPAHRARLLAAGALLLNAATTLSQLLVGGISMAGLPPHTTFIIISVISGLITVYVFYRAIILRRESA